MRALSLPRRPGPGQVGGRPRCCRLWKCASLSVWLMWKYGPWHSADCSGAGCGVLGLDPAAMGFRLPSGPLPRSGLLMLLLLLPPLSLLEDSVSQDSWKTGFRLLLLV